MESKLGNLVSIEARPGKEQEVADFLASALPLARDEQDTLLWFSARISSTKFIIFDTFPHTEGREAHLNGLIAKALFSKADELLSKPPVIERLEILAAKEPR